MKTIDDAAVRKAKRRELKIDQKAADQLYKVLI